MNDIDRVTETVTLLKARTIRLLESFQESENRLRRDFSYVAGDIEALEKRLDAVEAQLGEIALEINDIPLSHQRKVP